MGYKNVPLMFSITPAFLGRFLYFHLYQWKQPTVFPHYLLKLKQHKTTLFKVNHHSAFDRTGCSQLLQKVIQCSYYQYYQF